jgi:prepilin-type N-terminal cleavage/methylation domain-containing protein
MILPNAACHRPPARPGLRRRDGRTGSRPRAGGNSRAFTLVEIMVALAIFTMVIGSIYATWALVMRATEVGETTAAQAQRQRVVLRAIGDALMGVESFQASQRYYWFKLANGSEPFLSFAAHLPATYARNDKFVGEATIIDPDGNIRGLDASSRRVTFSLARGADGGKDLVLQQCPLLMDMDKDEQEYPLVLAHDIKEFTIEWWGTNEMNETGWFKDWDDKQTNSIPKMLRVHLVMGASTAPGKTGPDFAATRIYTVPSEMMPLFIQRGIGGPAQNSQPGGPGGPGGQPPISPPAPGGRGR